MLKLRRGLVIRAEPLTVDVAGESRRAWADESMVGEVQEGDEVLVNVEALDLELGSGGFDIVHANLSRGLEGEGAGSGEHVIKLNYTSLQHPVDPFEVAGEGDGLPALRDVAVLVCHLHGHLPAAAWAAAQLAPGLRIGYVQTPGGALPGGLSRDVRDLRSRGLLAGHVTAGACHGGEREAISVVGALDAAARRSDWDAVIAAPGPGILGSATRLGHGGMAALDNAHASLSAGLPTLLGPRLSSSDPRPRHRGLSHHTKTVLEMLLAPVRVAVPEPTVEDWPAGEPQAGGSPEEALAAVTEATRERHDLVVEGIDLAAYAASGLPTRTMGRSLEEDPLFFAAALASGAALARAAAGDRGEA